MKRLILLLLLLALSMGGPAFGQVMPEDSMPGLMIGTGTQFAVAGGSGAPVAVSSSEAVTLVIHSVEDVLTLQFETSTTSTATEISITGLAPAATYYKYEDDLHDPVVFTTDQNGGYTYIQDLSAAHLIFIKTSPSTLFIVNDETGGDCSTIGVWDAAGLTCTLAMDVNETVEIDSDDITLDGAGHRITGQMSGQGIYLPGRTGVTITNVIVESFTWNIYLNRSSGNIITGNALNGGQIGIYLTESGGNTISSNSFNGFSSYGLWANSYSNNNVISDNAFMGGSHAVWLNWMVRGNYVQGNTMDGGAIGIMLTWYASANTILENTIRNSANAGITSGYAWGNLIYNNNFIDNATQVNNYREFCNVYNMDLPKGGNYWNDYDSAEEGCIDGDSDGICDAPYTKIAYCADNKPWMMQDGWKFLTPEGLSAEIQEYLDAGLIDNAGVAGSLSSMLANADKAHQSGNENAADNIIQAFINYVNAQSSKHIDPDTAAILINAATYIQYH